MTMLLLLRVNYKGKCNKNLYLPSIVNLTRNESKRCSGYRNTLSYAN